jgi:hypothetical protein
MSISAGDAAVGDVLSGPCNWTVVSQTSYVRRCPVLEVQHEFHERPADAVLTR